MTLYRFDALWLDDCINDVFDALPVEKRDDKVALLYEMNKHNKVAVNTPVGQTERVDIHKVVTQGGTWGSLLCSNHIDTLGRRCRDTGEYMYMYKKKVEVMPLAMVDDLLGVAACGHDSLAMNIFINTQIELKKLQFHTPDAKGKSKCNVMHVGNNTGICPQLQVHGTIMQRITHDKYLGDIISSDGSNNLNIQSRVSKGQGLITQIMNILEKVTLGSHYFQVAMLLRESIFLNGITTNAEVWYGLSAKQVAQLESVDKLLLRKIFNTPLSTPSESMQLELGILSINTVIKARRINFLHYLMNTSESEMLFKVFKSQLDQPVQSDWTEQVKIDIIDLKIGLSLDEIKLKSKKAFKRLVKLKPMDYEYNRLLVAKQGHSKMDNLFYTKLEMQNYLKLENINADEARTFFRYRTRMAQCGENFRGQN